MKTDLNGTLNWIKFYGGNSNEQCYTASETYDGGLILGGFTESFVFNGDSYNPYIIKIDTAGNIEWARSFDLGSNYAWVSSIEQTFDSGYVATITPQFYDTIKVLKLDEQGGISWCKNYSGNVWANSDIINQVSDSGFIVGCWANDTIFGSVNLSLMKIDKIGNLIWAKLYTDSVETGAGGYFCLTSDSGIIGSGYHLDYSTNWAYECYLLKVGISGSAACPPMDISRTSVPISGISMSSGAITIGSGVSNNTVTVSSPPIITTTKCAVPNFVYDDNYESNFSIFPNPSRGFFTLKSQELMANCQIEIYNAFGEKVLISKCSNQKNYSIDLSIQPKGIYFVKIISDAQVATQKIIIQ